MNNLKENLNNVRSRVDLACRAVSRDPSEVTVLAVSKRHTVAKIEALHALGQTRFGENYVQEALDKMTQTGGLAIEWHFIGPMQSNKTREVAGHFQWVHSVDRWKIARRLSDQRPDGLPPLNVCLQVNIDREPQKAGVAPEQAAELARQCAELSGIRLRGLMCIPLPPSEDHDPASSYERMLTLFTELKSAGLNLDTLSMGMSADLESAIMHGSTMVRVGTDLFGPRPE
jgi:pyridoxal phosphate enzyme (YggS family)